jgi:NAD+ kinase
MKLNINFLDVCNKASYAAEIAISSSIKSKKAGTIVCNGADGTPTKLIDKVSEDAILEVFKNVGVPFKIFSEEFGEKSFGVPEFTVILDPIDGTYNAIFEIPFYSISIAICTPDLSHTYFGYVKNIANGNIYHAELGKGAYLNNIKIEPSKKTKIEDISISAYNYKGNFEFMIALCNKVRRIRTFGSIALELCFVASGKLDAFIDIRKSIRITDVAAGKLILEQSGGVVTDGLAKKLELKTDCPTASHLIASNGFIHEEILELIQNNEKQIFSNACNFTNHTQLKMKQTQKVKRMGIVSKCDNLKTLNMAKSIYNHFKNKVDILIANDVLEKLNLNLDCGASVSEMREKGVEFVISIGGDGTVLRNISFMDEPLPILGINMGTLGFLVDVNPNNAIDTIEQVLNGFSYNTRDRLAIYINGVELPCATNEVVLITAKPAKILTFEIVVDGKKIEKLRADGVIFATPTGSTAYSMSAGGPIVDPTVNASLIVPIAPFKLSSRPFVIHGGCIIEIEMTDYEKESLVVVDGQHIHTIKKYDKVTLKKAKYPAHFVKTSVNGFYEKIKNKLV